MTSIGTVEDYIELGLVRNPVIDRFASYVEYVDGHWLWTATKNHDGYGRFSVTEFGMRKLWLSHVWAYATFVARVPEGMEVRHVVLCKHRHCCNPKHLIVGTHLQNMRDGTDPRIDTHCPNGHEWAINNNLHIRKNGQRSCRTCNRDRSREYARAKAKEKRLVANR